MKEKKYRILGAFCLILLMISIILPTSAAEIIESSRGNVVYTFITVSANPDNAVAALLELKYYHSGLEMVGGDIAKDRFLIADGLEVIPEGLTFKVFFKISNGLPAHDYPVSVKVLEAYDAQEKPVTSLQFSETCIRVVTCQAERDNEQKLIPAFGMTRNQFKLNFKELISTYEAWINNPKQFKDFPYQRFMQLPIYPIKDFPSKALDDYMGTVYQPLDPETDPMDLFMYIYYYDLGTDYLSIENYWFEYPDDNYILFYENGYIEIRYKGYQISFSRISEYENDTFGPAKYTDISFSICRQQDSKSSLDAYYHYDENLPYPNYSLSELSIGGEHLTP